ncbi:monovalent cation/H+ antiporter subunit E [Corynebacterium sp. sy017]|uniref:monovalent cation/H+ antiporter subunit E n=1 Tax=Corynebacterium sp. sy017 TaxID=2499527 RepID=UPI0011863383|nr:monovalent cation/H+ antiporter subunit E [Corynebacterium sp. sy017]QDZ43631.1 monovalent cation/H+ antiporter subunit E [Corynebacterium sp. sy039]TSD91103.1 monovalent cation/H+ antiporter subunit E [Corynebacterium sp. SY003]
MPHFFGYALWLIWQIILATWVVTWDVLTGSKKVDPCVVHYPLRVTTPGYLTAFSASITITPGTLSLSFIDDTHLAVHAVHGSNPQEVLADLAHMEEKLAPHIRGIKHDLDQAPVFYPAPTPGEHH